MQLLRRQAFRAVSSSASAPRALSTRTPFVFRAKNQTVSSTLFRRFASNDADTQATQAPEADVEGKSEAEVEAKSEQSTPSSADQHDTSTVQSAIDSVSETASSVAETASSYASSAAETASSYASSAAQSVNNAYDSARDSVQRRSYERVPRAVEPSSSVYVGNLSFEATEDGLQEMFASEGMKIGSLKIARDLRNFSKGFGYVNFASVEEATAAIKRFDNSEFAGRKIICNYQVASKPRERPQNPPSKTLFVGNLAFEMSDADLNALFKNVRNVVDVRVAIDRRTGQPRGFAHAEFTDEESAAAGMEELRGKEVYGRNLRIDYSGGGLKREAFSDRPQRPGYGGGRGGYGNDRGPRDGGRGGYRNDRIGDRGRRESHRSNIEPTFE